MTINPGQSRHAQIASLLRRARAAEAAGRVPETISFLREVVQLDPHDRTTLRRLGDLFRLRMNRLREAATWYARAARANEREELPVRAIAVWRTVLQCDPSTSRRTSASAPCTPRRNTWPTRGCTTRSPSVSSARPGSAATRRSWARSAWR